MRIALVTFFYSPAGGGIPRYVEEISRKLAERGHRIDIITATFGKERRVERNGRITVYRLKCMDIFDKNERENKENAREFLDFLRKYARRKPSIIVAQNIHASVRSIGHIFSLNIASLENDIPIALTVHSFIQNDEFKQMKYQLLKNLHWEKIITVGSNLAESLFSEGIPSENIKIVHPPIDTKKFIPNLGKKWLRSRIGINEKDVLILHASRLDSERVAKEKGIYTLLKAFSQIKDKEVKLLISTAPTTLTFEKWKEEAIEKIKKTAQLLGVENRVIIQTFNPEEMHLVYNGADLFTMASEMESFGLVYAEALSCEIPVIGTGVGGIPEVIEDGRSGLLVPPNDHIELSRQIRKMIKDKDKLKRMGIIGRKAVIEKFDIDKICKNLEGIYNSIIEKKGNSGFLARIFRE